MELDFYWRNDIIISTWWVVSSTGQNPPPAWILQENSHRPETMYDAKKSSLKYSWQSAQFIMLLKDTSCSWESEEIKYYCSGETSSVADTGQFLLVLALLVLILILMGLCKMCENEKEKLDRLRDSVEKIGIATGSIDIELGILNQGEGGRSRCEQPWPSIEKEHLFQLIHFICLH